MATDKSASVAMLEADDAEERPDLVEVARSLEPKIRAAEREMEETRCVPIEIIHELYDRGPFRALMPREVGGVEADPNEWLEMVEELSRINGSVGWLAMLHSGQTMLAPDVMRKLVAQDRWIAAGNVGRSAGKAVRVDGGYRISGRWPFCSGSAEANWFFGASELYDENDQVVLHPNDGMPWFVAAVWPKSDVILHDTWDGLGLRATSSGDMEVVDIFVPSEMVDELGSHFRHYDRPLFRAAFDMQAHGAHALGLAQAALDEFRRLVTQIARRGSFRQRMLGRQQVHQVAYAKADSLVRAARLLLHDTVRKAYANAQHDSYVDFELRVLLHQNMVFTVNAAREAVELIYRQAGSPAVFRGQPLERIYRDISVAAQHIVVNETTTDTAGQYWFTRDLPGGPEVDLEMTFLEPPLPQTLRDRPDHPAYNATVGPYLANT